MGKVLDQDARFVILRKAADRYPDPVDISDFHIDDTQVQRATFTYLEEKGLLRVEWLGMVVRLPNKVRCTAKGYDVVEACNMPDLEPDDS